MQQTKEVDLENTDETENEGKVDSDPPALGRQGAASCNSTQTPETARASPGEKELLAQEALRDILEGITQLGEQAARSLFVVPDWNTKYRRVLGPYRRFCERQRGVLRVTEWDRGGYTVQKAKTDATADEAAPVDGRNRGKKRRKLTGDQRAKRAWGLLDKSLAPPGAMPLGRQAGQDDARQSGHSG